MKKVTLDTPLKIGDALVDSISLRRPTAGEMRGLKLLDICQMEVGAICTLVSRIGTPALTSADLSALDPADLLTLSTEVTDFLEPKAGKSLAT